MEHVHLDIEGMSCGHCVASVERALTDVSGVGERTVRIGGAEVAFDGARTDSAKLIAAVAEAGYPAKVTAERR